MCGITGFCNFKTNFKEKEELYTNLLTNMRQTISHRGNDQSGHYLKENVGLAHARLSIRDIANGTQPMVRHVGNREYALAYNGEIYNTDELIPVLKRAGFLFHTTSDTEVILYSYIHFGPSFVNHLNGIFAFALWDDAIEKLFLYRDRVGVKPLFYYNNPTSNEVPFAFASEPKALFTHPSIKPELTKDGLREILSLGPAHTAGNGIFKNVYEVLPGHYMCYSKNNFTDTAYWDLTAAEHIDDYPATVEKVSYLVRDAVKRQMISDVPVCTFLSGGIDSSIVTAIAADYLKERGETLNTFSFDFKENEKYFKSNAFQPERDLPYIKIMLDHYNTHHTYLECDQNILADTLYMAVDARDYPGMADVDASLLYFCSLVKAQNKVALTGECADEIFGGYPWFYRQELLNTDGFPWSSDMSMRTLFLKENLADELDLKNYSYDSYKTSLAKAPVLSSESKEETRRRQIAYLNIKWFMQTLLDRMDRTSMYSGLESRVPFADHRIIEYVFNVPWEMKYQNGVEKALLRDATKDLLPEELLHRKKSPYPKTYHPGYEQLLTKRFYDILQDKNAPIAPLLNAEKVTAFLRSPKEYGKPWYGQLMAGPQLIAYYIQLNYWLQKYNLILPL